MKIHVHDFIVFQIYIMTRCIAIAIYLCLSIRIVRTLSSGSHASSHIDGIDRRPPITPPASHGHWQEHIAVLEASRLLQAQLDDQIAKQQLADEQTAQQLAVAAALATDRFERAIVSNTIDALREALVANVAQIESLPALADNAAVSALRRVAQTKLFALVETGINKAVRARDLAALKSLIALIEINIAWMEPSPSSSSDSTSSATSAAPQFLTNAKRAIPYLELRTAKPDHNTWTCDEFIMAFEVVARSKSLHVDSIDAAVQYFRDEVVDGSLLGALEEDVFLKEAVPAGVRRARLLLAFKELN
jgi:hypothetical protein